MNATTAKPQPSDRDDPTPGTNTMAAGGGGHCTYTYATHSGAPVVTKASCSISRKDLDKGTEPTVTQRNYVRKLGGHDKCYNDDAGHILANQLGGFAVDRNLFPQAPHLNRGTWEQLEKAIYACLKTGGASKATLSWTFSYSSTSSERPTTATYHASFDEKCSAMHQSFSNKCDHGESAELIV
jgi:hypothetical protein